MNRGARSMVDAWFRLPALQVAIRLGLGVVCALTMIAIRAVVDTAAPGAGPFALIYPAVLLATLYGRWEAGAVAFAICFGWTWLQVLPLAIVQQGDQAVMVSHIALNAASVLIVLAFAETFRGKVETARQQREAEIDRRAVLLAELEHRTKNNFALVASLLELQKRREKSEPIRRAFDDAIGRVRTFSEAYTHLAGEQGEGVVVEMRPYLERLVARVSSALLPPHIALTSRFADVSLPRESAVAIGLFANEALTNCAKYAFPDDRAGKVHVEFDVSGTDWQLTIRDNGVGEAPHAPGNSSGSSAGGIGSQLLGAFARQARAKHDTRFLDDGCEVSLVYRQDAA